MRRGGAARAARRQAHCVARTWVNWSSCCCRCRCRCPKRDRQGLAGNLPARRCYRITGVGRRQRRPYNLNLAYTSYRRHDLGESRSVKTSTLRSPRLVRCLLLRYVDRKRRQNGRKVALALQCPVIYFPIPHPYPSARLPPHPLYISLDVAFLPSHFTLRAHHCTLCLLGL